MVDKNSDRRQDGGDEGDYYVFYHVVFERLLKKEAEKGNVEISETEIRTDLTFEL